MTLKNDNTQHNDTQHNDTQYEDIQHNDIQNYYTLHSVFILSAFMPFLNAGCCLCCLFSSDFMLSLFRVALCYVLMLSAISVLMLIVVIKFFRPIADMLTVFMPTVIMESVILLNVVAASVLYQTKDFVEKAK